MLGYAFAILVIVDFVIYVCTLVRTHDLLKSFERVVAFSMFIGIPWMVTAIIVTVII